MEPAAAHPWVLTAREDPIAQRRGQRFADRHPPYRKDRDPQMLEGGELATARLRANVRRRDQTYRGAAAGERFCDPVPPGIADRRVLQIDEPRRIVPRTHKHLPAEVSDECLEIRAPSARTVGPGMADKERVLGPDDD